MKKVILLCVLVGALSAFAVAEKESATVLWFRRNRRFGRNRDAEKESKSSVAPYVSQQQETKPSSSFGHRLLNAGKNAVNHVRRAVKHAGRAVKHSWFGRWFRKIKKFIKRKLKGAGKLFFKRLKKNQKRHIKHTKYVQVGKNFYSQDSPLNCAVEDEDEGGELEAEAICADKVEQFAQKRDTTSLLETGASKNIPTPEKTKGPKECENVETIFSLEDGLPRACPEEDVFSVNGELEKCLIAVYESDNAVKFENKQLFQVLKVFKKDDGISYILDCSGTRRRRRLLQPGGTSAGS